MKNKKNIRDKKSDPSHRPWALKLLKDFCRAASSPSPQELPACKITLTKACNDVLAHRSPQMKRRGLHCLRSLLGETKEGRCILHFMPRFLRAEPDRLHRQKHVIQDDSIPKKIGAPWVRDFLLWVLNHDKARTWTTSKSAYQQLTLLHNMMKKMGLLDCDSLNAFWASVANWTDDDIRKHCMLFARNKVCGKTGCSRYVSVMNLIFFDIFGVLRTRITRGSIDRKRSILTLDDLDEMVSSSSEWSRNDDARASRRYFNHQEIRKLLSVSEISPKRWIVLCLALTTGLRRQGILNIKTSDVAKEIDGCHWMASEMGKTLTKGKKVHTFVIHALAACAIERWLNTPEAVGGRRLTPSPFLFPSAHTDNGQMSTSTLSNIFKNICTDAGLSGDHRAHLHAMRHTYAHCLVHEGNSLDNIRTALGHSDISTTRVYTAGGMCYGIKVPEAWKNTETQ